MVKTINTHGTFEQAIAKSSEELQAIARSMRELIEDVYPDVVEVPWPTQQVAGYGVGPKKMSEHFCYIAGYPEHINLGFYYGVDLPDPDHLLEGEGKKFRHVKIYTAGDVDRPELRALIETAVDERQAVLGANR